MDWTRPNSQKKHDPLQSPSSPWVANISIPQLPAAFACLGSHWTSQRRDWKHTHGGRSWPVQTPPHLNSLVETATQKCQAGQGTEDLHKKTFLFIYFLWVSIPCFSLRAPFVLQTKLFSSKIPVSWSISRVAKHVCWNFDGLANIMLDVEWQRLLFTSATNPLEVSGIVGGALEDPSFPWKSAGPYRHHPGTLRASPKSRSQGSWSMLWPYEVLPGHWSSGMGFWPKSESSTPRSLSILGFWRLVISY